MKSNGYKVSTNLSIQKVASNMAATLVLYQHTCEAIGAYDCALHILAASKELQKMAEDDVYSETHELLN